MQDGAAELGEAPRWRETSADRLRDMRMAADRILLAVMQTSLSLIGFGFTIYQIFSAAAQKAGIARETPVGMRLGLSLLVLGLILLSAGIWSRLQSERELRARRRRLVAQGAQDLGGRPGLSPILVVACLMLAVAVSTLATLGVKLALF
jgi:uncharacterized membrane protein YidH (DUF202 family)